MPEPVAIDKNNKLSPAEDYHFLRREGIRLIQTLSGKVWTDYNTHDPGITFLEALCYTLTDLGYRTSFAIKDILTPKVRTADTWQQIFYTARQVLPCNPVTITDYRKIIIDTEGVKNAWVEISEDYEIQMYLQADEETAEPLRQVYSLTYDQSKGNNSLRLRGLYKVYVEYEDDIIDNKNEEKIAQKIKAKLKAHRNLCEDFISVSTIEYDYFSIEAELQVHEGSDIEKINARLYEVVNDFFSPSITFYSLEQMMEKGCSAAEIFEGPLLKHGFIETGELEKSERFKDIYLSDVMSLISQIEGVIAIKKFALPLESKSALSNFTEWISDTKDSQKAPRLDIDNSVVTFMRSGDRHRNASDTQPSKERVKSMLSFLQSAKFNSRLKGTVKDLPVPTGEFMDIAEYFPFQKTLPATYGMAETYIDHKLDEVSIRNAVNELLDKNVGIAIRELINKLLAEEPDNSSVKDIINDLLKIQTNEGLIKQSINSLLDDKSVHALLQHLIEVLLVDTQDDTSFSEKILILLERHKPNLFALSKKTTILEKITPQTIRRTLFDLVSEQDPFIKQEQIIKVREAYKKYQLQQLDSKKKMTLQLRGFFMVFEQILADYLSQLANIRQLFSFDPEMRQTFFTQNLQGVSDIESLFIDYEKYQKLENDLSETAEIYDKRRNVILDHLLGRFGEDMSKYAYFMKASYGKNASKRLIEDKIDFLSDLIEVGNYRGRGFNYSNAEEAWDSDNVEGMKKRICRLLGIKEHHKRNKNYKRITGDYELEDLYKASDYNKKFIAPDAIYVDKIKLDDNIERYIVILTDPGNRKDVLLKSEPYEFESEAQKILNYILEYGVDLNLYEKDKRRDKWIYQLKRATMENDFEPVASGQFLSREESEIAFKKTIETLTEYAQDENFHIVEHILLRPRVPGRSRSTKPKTVLDADVVDFLSVAYVSDKAVPKVSQQERITYKFKILNVKDTDKKDKTIWYLSLITGNESEVLSVNEEFVLYKHLTRRIEQIRQFASDSSNFIIDKNADDYFIFSIMGGDRSLAVSKNKYLLREDAEEEITKMVSFFSYEVEQIKDKMDNFDDISFKADPYSLQISILIPEWPAKFRNLTFKHLLEKTIYLETPAHIYPHVYWLDHKQMRDFEEAYKLWLEELAHTDIPNTEIVNNLIYQLNDLRK